MNIEDDSLQDLINKNLALGRNPGVNPVIPTAQYEDTGSSNPYFDDARKRQEDRELLEQIRRGQAGVQYTGNLDGYQFYRDRQIDPNKLGNLGAEFMIKYDIRSSKGWGEQNTYARDAWLRWMKGETSNYFWNPSDLDDPSNIHNHSSYWSALKEGVGKWFNEYEEDAEFQKMKEKISTVDPEFTEARRLEETDSFLRSNKGVENVLRAGGIDLYDYTRNTKNSFGYKFAINNAVIDALQNIRLEKWNEENQVFGSQLGDMLAYSLQDPLLVRDFAATTALTLGLGAVQAGATTVGKGLTQAGLSSARAMSVARGASNLLQLTSPFTGLVEGPAYKILQAMNSKVGQKAYQTVMARMLAIGTEAGIASGIVNYTDQRNKYDWKNLVMQRTDSLFEPDWKQVGIASATGFGVGGAILGLMRFGLGAALGEVKYIRKGDWKSYSKNIISSLDTWAQTKDGLTVFGNTLSGGRGMIFGDLIDKYMSKVTDTRDYASILVNGQRLFATSVFSPQVAAKANFDEKAASKVAVEFEKATKLPGEIIQQLGEQHPVARVFNNLVDPDYLERTGTTYDEAAKIISEFNKRQDNIFGPIDPTSVGVATGRAIDEISAKNSIVALAEIFEIDRLSRVLQREGSSFNAINDLHARTTGNALDFGKATDRDNFRVLVDYVANGERRALKYLETLSFARDGESRADIKLPDGKVVSGNIVRDSIRRSLGLDRFEEVDGVMRKDTRTSRIFITDSEDGSSPTFIISVEPDGTLNRHATVLKKDSQGRITVESEITKAADYKPENIRTLADMQKTIDDLGVSVKKAAADAEAEVKAAKKKRLEELSKESESVSKALKDMGKMPTRRVLEKHFNLSKEEAGMAEIVMETLGMDIEGAVIKIAESKGKSLERLTKAGAKASIQWEAMESGIHALIRTTRHSDFGSLVHEMGHYNRMVMFGTSEEHRANRHKIGISDELWNKFLKWTGYEGEWEMTASKMSKEQRKAEEKFANAWAFYIRNIMTGDGKTNVTGLHRLFSALGDHLGDIGKKMESQKALEAGLVLDDVAKEVYQKLFARSESKLTKFWEMAEKNVFKSMDPESRAKLGQHILGEELWKSYKGSVEAAVEKAAKKTDGIATPRPKRIPINEVVDGIQAKISGDAFNPTKKAIKLALNAGLTSDQIQANVARLRASLDNPESLEPSTLRPNGDPAFFAKHVENMSDEELKALPEGKILRPVEGVVRWVFNPAKNEIDASFPLMRVTKVLVDQELTRRNNRKIALERLAESKKRLEEAKAKVAEVKAEVEKKTEEAISKVTEPETPKVEVSSVKTTEKRTAEGDIKAAMGSMAGSVSPAFVEDTAKRLNNVLTGKMTFEQFTADAGIKPTGTTATNSKYVLEKAKELGITELDGKTYSRLLSERSTSNVTVELARIKAEETSRLAAAVEEERAAAAAEVAAIKAIDETEPAKPEVSIEQEPEAAITDIAASVDPRFIDSTGNPVPELTVTERIHAESTAEVISEVRNTQAEVAQIVMNAADRSVPLENIRVQEPPARAEAPINVEENVNRSVTDVVSTASEVVENLRRQSDAAARNLTEEQLNLADQVVEIVSVDPKRLQELLKKLYMDETFARESEDIQQLVAQYVDARSRYIIADDMLTKLGFLTEEDRTSFKSLSKNIVSTLDNSTDVDLLVQLRTDPSSKLGVDPTSSSDRKLMNVELQSQQSQKIIVDRILKESSVSLEQLEIYLNYKTKVVEGTRQYARQRDLDIVKRYASVKEEYDNAVVKLQSDPENKELLKFVNSKDVLRDVGYYNAAASRIQNMDLYGTSIAPKTGKERKLVTVLEDIMQERFTAKAPASVATPLVSNSESKALAAGLDTKTLRNVGATIDDMFALGSSEKPTKNLPVVKPVRESSLLPGKNYGMNTVKQRALILTNEFLTNGGSNIKTSKLESNPSRWVEETFDSPAKTLKAAAEPGFKPANDNPFFYNAMLAFLIDDSASIARMFPNDFKKFIQSGDPVDYIEGAIAVNKRSLSRIPAVVEPAKMTERRLAYLLLTNKDFVSRFDRIAQKHNVTVQDVIARAYSSQKGISAWLIEKLDLDPKLSLDEVLKETNNWIKSRETSGKLHRSVNTIAERLGQDLQKEGNGKKGISGDLGDEDGPAVFDSIQSRYDQMKDDVHVATFVDRLQSLFYEYLRSRKVRGDDVNLGDYFVARIQGNESPDGFNATIRLLKEISGVELNLKQIEYRDRKLADELSNFFSALEKDPEIPDALKNSIQIMKEERLGVGKKKASGELMQASIEENVSYDIRNRILERKIENADDLLSVIASSNSEYRMLASDIKNASRKNPKKVGVYPGEIDGSNGFYNPRILSIVLSPNRVYGTSAEISMHEIIHSLTGESWIELGNRDLTGSQYLNSVKQFIQDNRTDSYNYRVELAEAYVDMIESGKFRIDDIEALNDNNKVDLLEHYGMSSVAEMMSEAFTNRAFARALDEIETTSRYGYVSTVLNRIIEIVENLFNLEPKTHTTLLRKIIAGTVYDIENVQFSAREKDWIKEVSTIGIKNLDPETYDAISAALGKDLDKIKKDRAAVTKARNDLSASEGRFLDEGLYQAKESEVILDAVDLRRRKLSELGLNEELSEENIAAMQRVLNGLAPVDVMETTIFDTIKTKFELSPERTIRTDFTGKKYRDLSTDERREFLLGTLMPKIQEAMGERNFSAGLYSAASDSKFGRKLNGLIGGAVRYGDTADSNSLFIQFISKIFDPMMDLRDGELKYGWKIPSIDKLNAEVNNILLRSNLIQTQDKIVTRIKDKAEVERINNTAWLYLTRPEALPDGPNKDLILDLINARNKFNEITVEILSNYGNLSKKTDPKKYGTSHTVNQFAKENQKQFVDALTNFAMKRTLDSKEISVITSEALGWLEIKRDSQTDNIQWIRINEDSPLAVLLEKGQAGKKLEWDGKTRKMLSDVSALSEEAQKTHTRALSSNEDYVDSWKKAYSAKGQEFTAIRQSMEIAKNRYLGIDFTDSKSANPRRQSIGEGRNYTEERILTHEEIATDSELSKFFSTDILDLSHKELRGIITDATMTRMLTDFFGVRMSMGDLLQLLGSSVEEYSGRSNLSLKEIESRKRGYERLRDAWDNSIGNMMGSKDSVDIHYETLLNNSRPLVVAASGLRASIMSVPETGRALLTSNKNRSKIMQVVPNLVKLAKMVGPGGKRRRLARAQMISASHWLRGLATDHMLHRHGIHPDNPFQGVILGQGAGGMVGNFINTWKVAGQKNRTETSSFARFMNRASAFSAAAEAPLAFVNDCTTLLHIWNAQENFTTNIASMKKMAKILNDNPAAEYKEFGKLAKECGLLPKEALDLNTAGVLNLKYIEIIEQAAKNQALYTDGILDARKMYTWAGDDPDKVEAINMMGSYINMTARHTNVEPTLLDIRVNQSIYGRALSNYMQFLLSVGVQEIGRRRRTSTSGYSEHLAGLVLMDIMAYSVSRSLANPEDDNLGGLDEFEKNPMDFMVRTATSMPLLGSYAWLSSVMRHSIMGASEFLGGPEAEQKFRLPDLIGGPATTAPSRLMNAPETIKGWYNEGTLMLNEMLGD